MHPEDFLNNSIINQHLVNLLAKKLLSIHFHHFNIPKESMRRYLNAVLESGLITKRFKIWISCKF